MWNILLNKTLLEFGFVASRGDRCMYLLKVNEVLVMTLVVTVDDILAAYNPETHTQLYQKFLRHLEASVTSPKDIRDLGDATSYVGLTIDYDRENQILKLHQTPVNEKSLITKLVSLTRLESWKPTRNKAQRVSTPGLLKKQLTLDDCPQPGTKEWHYMQKVPYRTTLGMLLFLSIMTRVDILFDVLQGTRVAHNPGYKHWQHLKNIVKYLVTFPHCGLTYNGKIPLTDFHVYWDADWASNPDTRRSVTGYVFMLCGAAVHYVARFQKLVAKSSFESELISLYSCSTDLVWIRFLLEDLGIKIATIPVWGDNKTAIYRSTEVVRTPRTRHIDVRFFSQADLIEAKVIELKKVNAHDNLADLLTKSHTEPRYFNPLRKGLMNLRE